MRSESSAQPAVDPDSSIDAFDGSPTFILGSDRIFRALLRGSGLLFLGLFLFLFVKVLLLAWPALEHAGFSILSSAVWNPNELEFGALSFIFGTLVTSLVALALALPVGVGAALFLTELAPYSIRFPIGFTIEMLAAIPSVIYGLWGIFVLVPLMQTWVQPILISTLGFLPLFEGPAFGFSLFSAAVVLSIMVLPTITSVSREVFKSVPVGVREGALALGATRWEMIRLAVLRSSLSGVVGAGVLGLGRALGETMAVTMVIGNRNELSASLLAPGQTMASLIANEYPEAMSELHISALALIGVLLFGVSTLTNFSVQLLISRNRVAHG